MLDLAKKTVIVAGAGRSGLALVRLVRRAGGEPRLTDSRTAEQINEDDLQALAEQGVVTEFGGHTPEFLDGAHLLVLSPGVPYGSSLVAWARAKSVPVFGEIEFAFQFAKAPVIGVTGSNGKTTVVNLISRVLTEAGIAACLCGNVGYPFSDYCLTDREYGYYVLELSSFQLESLLAREDPLIRAGAAVGFCPKISVLLNFSENHLDRHADLEEYFQAKWRLFQNQGAREFAVVNADNERIVTAAASLPCKVHPFSSVAQDGTRGNPNFAAVRQVAAILNIHPGVVDTVLKDFTGVEHRMEYVRTLDGVRYINDSKATTAEAGRWALNSVSGPVIMICGGRDKNIDFAPLRDLVRERVKTMVVIGEASEKLLRTFADSVPLTACTDLQEAVRTARQRAREGDSILLSPMCASFDMFNSFEHRGEVFKNIVKELA